MRRLLLLLVLAACRDSTSPLKRYDGTYALVTPLPYQHTLNGDTFTVVSETLYVYANDALFERHFVTQTTTSAACCGTVWVSGDSIYFGGQGASDSQMLDAGTLSGSALTVRAMNGVALLGWNFVYARVH